jgi:cobalt/nickel transport system permease protein
MSVSLFSVHLSDGAMSWPWVVGGFVCLAALLAVAVRHVRDEEVPRIALLSAAFFVGSSIHIKLAVVPTSVHLILNGLVGVVLGRRAPLAVTIGLLLQYVLLSHGGLTTLGLNGCIAGLPAVGAGLCYPVLRRWLPAVACGVTLGAAAAAGAVLLNFLALWLGGVEDWQTLARLVLLAHVPVVIIESVLLGAIVAYLAKVRPDLLVGHTRAAE